MPMVIVGLMIVAGRVALAGQSVGQAADEAAQLEEARLQSSMVALGGGVQAATVLVSLAILVLETGIIAANSATTIVGRRRAISASSSAGRSQCPRSAAAS